MPLLNIRLGVEWDQRLRADLISVLRQIGAVQKSKWWGVGGSQEISCLVVDFEDHEITAETETFVGLTLSGEQEIVEHIAGLVRLRSQGSQTGD